MTNFFTELFSYLSPANIIGTIIIASLIYVLVIMRDKFWETIQQFLPQKPLLIYVSSGGTCRDPIAKIITEKALGERSKEINIVAAGIAKGSTPYASKAARLVIKENYGEDLLYKHKTQTLKPALVEKAELVLCMTTEHAYEVKKANPKHLGKIYTLGQFTGENTNIINPYCKPNETDADAMERYVNCFHQLREIIEKHLDKIYSSLVA